MDLDPPPRIVAYTIVERIGRSDYTEHTHAYSNVSHENMKRISIDYVLLLLLLTSGLYLQFHSIGTLVYTFPDEGVYLYAAKLVSQGYLIYKDFFLIHLPFWIYINVIVLTLLHWNIDAYHLLYATYIISGVIPLYFVIYTLTRNRVSSFLGSLIFILYPEMVQWDSHFFAMRQASEPLLAWGLYHLIHSKKLSVAGIFLALFSIGLVTNFLLATVLIGVWSIYTYVSNPEQNWSLIRQLGAPYLIITLIYFVIFMLIPGSYQNVFGYQLANSFIPYLQRFDYLKSVFMQNGVIYTLGLLGCFGYTKYELWVKVFVILAILITLFGTITFYPHYLVVLGIPLAMSAGLFISHFAQSRITNILTVVVVISALFATSGKHLKSYLIDATTPDFYTVVAHLQSAPEPVFSFEPIYAIYAIKNLTKHYKVADPRSFKVLGNYYSIKEYQELVDRSNTLLLDTYTKSIFPNPIYNLLPVNFEKTYVNNEAEIWVRKNLISK